MNQEAGKKKFWKSKMFWFNFLSGVIAIIEVNVKLLTPLFGAWMPILIIGFPIVNLFLRSVTREQIEFKL